MNLLFLNGISIPASTTIIAGIEFIDLADELEKLLDRKVDLVSKAGIKPQYYQAIESELLYI